MSERTQTARMDEGRFEALYEKYANDVLRVSYFYLGDRHQAEDVTQDVFVRLLTSAPDLEEGHEKPWLLKVALNRCRDIWRAAWVKRVVLGSPAMELAPAPDRMVLTAKHLPAGSAGAETSRTQGGSPEKNREGSAARIKTGR